MQSTQSRRMNLTILGMAAAMLGGCGVFMRGATVVDIEVAGVVSLLGGSAIQVPQKLISRPRTDRSLTLSPVSEAVVFGLLVSISRVNNFYVGMSFTNQTSEPIAVYLTDGSAYFSMEQAPKSVGQRPLYALYSLAGGKQVLVHDARTQALSNPVVLQPNHQLYFETSSRVAQEKTRYIQNFGVSIDHERSLITHSSVGNSMKATFPVEIAGEKLVLELQIQSVKEYQRQSYY